MKIPKGSNAPSKGPFVWLDAAGAPGHEGTSFLFSRPERILVFRAGEDANAYLDKAQSLADRGRWVAGYFEYEFGYFLDPALSVLAKRLGRGGRPLAWLGVFGAPSVRFRPAFAVSPPLAGTDLKPSVTRREYAAAIRKIRFHLRRGDTYQINYTFKLRFKAPAPAFRFYLGLRANQPTAYSAYIETGTEAVCSFSPELFFRKHGSGIEVRPMKGTLPRGRDPRADARARHLLASDPKTVAENLMITDLLRNDLGRISSAVTVPALFETETYGTLHQMVSRVRGKARRGVRAADVLRALFPSGSVTGAPKIASMKLIADLEKGRRGVYTGAIGYLHRRDAVFNVAIRTVVVRQGLAEMGVGGGVVADSKPGLEYREALLKAKFLTVPRRAFGIFETLLWTRHGGYYLLAGHLDRLRRSCLSFGRRFDPAAARRSLLGEARSFTASARRVRLEIGPAGAVSVRSTPLPRTPGRVTVALSPVRTDPGDLFLYHKTTRRELYETERRSAAALGHFEVIFANRRGQLTEGSFTNLFLRIGGTLWTPPLRCGLLPGVLRARLLRRGIARERVLRIDDLERSEELWIGNSLRGLVPAVFCGVLPANSVDKKTVQGLISSRKGSL